MDSKRVVGCAVGSMMVALVVTLSCGESNVRRCNSGRDCPRELVCASGICAKPNADGTDGGEAAGGGQGTGGGNAQGTGGGGSTVERDGGGSVVIVEIDAGPTQACMPGTECRPIQGACDVPEMCNADGTCPGNGVKGPGTQCRTAVEACDVTEVCTGDSPSCPDDIFLTKDTACRAAAGDCDVAEVCTGLSAACPADVKAPAGVTCRGQNGVCDAAEVCDGSNAACPADAVVPASQKKSCRPADTRAGFNCDKEDFCNGATKDCPDTFLDATATCRAAAGDCDAVEKCTGTSAACPADVKESAAKVCRGVNANDICDVEERCNGTVNVCPTDSLQPKGTPCRGVLPDDDCDVADTCDGMQKLCENKYKPKAGPECRASGGPCDPAEFCPGNAPKCPGNSFRPGSECAAETDCLFRATCVDQNAQCPARSPKGQNVPCGDQRSFECNQPDRCDGAGSCDPRFVSQGGFCQAGCTGVPGTCDDGSTKQCGSRCAGDGSCDGQGWTCQ